MSTDNIEIEYHPLQPFIPDGARLLMLGSFPPSKKRWCMDFFYPNFINDMWRIFGLVFFSDKEHFIIKDEKCFDRQSIISFLKQKRIAIYDTAIAVRRIKNTASDKDLEIVERTDINAMLMAMPYCHTIITTGQKATDQIVERFSILQPKVGSYTEFDYAGRQMRLYRMPSSSRAYPMKIEKKADYYRDMFSFLSL
ncbi:uracil-DNA glycosylase family protein [Xylanibacter oryzae]|uniref:uracil-DNA glycosylase family protein n=1 Tax=Xylanibacter oryzae TaxID=185293 RepID=UPI0004B096B6|nr:uracil-DNA glycosylase family protein [Xylanibacter oryzae]